MIAEAHEIREKQSANRAHVINNVAIKGQNNADDSVIKYFLLFFSVNIKKNMIYIFKLHKGRR